MPPLIAPNSAPFSGPSPVIAPSMAPRPAPERAPLNTQANVGRQRAATEDTANTSGNLRRDGRNFRAKSSNETER